VKEHYGLFKKGDSRVVFAGRQEVVQRAYDCLKDCFYFTAGTAKAREDAFPYFIKQL
jgi:hypothetical protein